MIAAWMLYSVAVSAVFGACALALEHGLGRRGMPLRWLWVGALLASLAVSALPWVPAREPEYIGVHPEWIGSPQVVNAPRGMPVFLPAPDVIVAADPWVVARMEVFDRPLFALWALSTAMGVLYLVGTHRTLSRRRRLWRRTTLDGVETLLSRDVGPAVVGFLDAAIVVPAWVVRMDAERRRLVLAHEEEHLRAGDARLISLALLSLAAMPWNAPLWWQVRRLRHAVELDCDARVLEGEADAESYCELLIEVGERASMRGVAFAAFAESSSFLERRILSMVGPRPRRWTLAAGLVVSLAGMLLVYACEAPVPTLPVADGDGDEPELVVARAEPVAVPMTEPVVAMATPVPVAPEPVRVEAAVTVGEEVSSHDLLALVWRRYPELRARGLPLEQAVWFAIDRSGRIVESWLGKNIYLNFENYRPLRELTFPEGSTERARAAAEHSELQRAILEANVPGLPAGGVYASYFYTPGIAIHIITATPSPIPPGRRVGVASPEILNRAIRAELER